MYSRKEAINCQACGARLTLRFSERALLFATLLGWGAWCLGYVAAHGAGYPTYAADVANVLAVIGGGIASWRSALQFET
jgi:hypothetical protein